MKQARYQPSLAHLTQREIDTIIAALRYWQNYLDGVPAPMSQLEEIATNGRTGDDAMMLLTEIDELIEGRLN
jgi:hypothetical protein